MASRSKTSARIFLNGSGAEEYISQAKTLAGILEQSNARAMHKELPNDVTIDIKKINGNILNIHITTAEDITESGVCFSHYELVLDSFSDMYIIYKRVVYILNPISLKVSKVSFVISKRRDLVQATFTRTGANPFQIYAVSTTPYENKIYSQKRPIYSLYRESSKDITYIGTDTSDFFYNTPAVTGFVMPYSSYDTYDPNIYLITTIAYPLYYEDDNSKHEYIPSSIENHYKAFKVKITYKDGSAPETITIKLLSYNIKEAIKQAVHEEIMKYVDAEYESLVNIDLNTHSALVWKDNVCYTLYYVSRDVRYIQGLSKQNANFKGTAIVPIRYNPYDKSISLDGSITVKNTHGSIIRISGTSTFSVSSAGSGTVNFVEEYAFPGNWSWSDTTGTTSSSTVNKYLTYNLKASYTPQWHELYTADYEITVKAASLVIKPNTYSQTQYNTSEDKTDVLDHYNIDQKFLGRSSVLVLNYALSNSFSYKSDPEIAEYEYTGNTSLSGTTALLISSVYSSQGTGTGYVSSSGGEIYNDNYTLNKDVNDTLLYNRILTCVLEQDTFLLERLNLTYKAPMYEVRIEYVLKTKSSEIIIHEMSSEYYVGLTFGFVISVGLHAGLEPQNPPELSSVGMHNESSYSLGPSDPFTVTNEITPFMRLPAVDMARYHDLIINASGTDDSRVTYGNHYYKPFSGAAYKTREYSFTAALASMNVYTRAVATSVLYKDVAVIMLNVIPIDTSNSTTMQPGDFLIVDGQVIDPASIGLPPLNEITNMYVI